MNKKLLSILFLLFSLCLLNAEKFYWENPKKLSIKNGNFLKTASNKNIYAAVWEESVTTTSGRKYIYLSLAVYSEGKWNVYKKISEPISYTSEIPAIASITVTDDDSILIVAIKNRNTMSIFKTDDKGKTIKKKDIVSDINDLSTPKVSVLSNGKFILFLSHVVDEKSSLFYTRSDDGFNWEKLSKFDFGNETDRIFLPVHTCTKNKDLIVFQVLNTQNDRRIFSLYSAYSFNAGRTWSKSKKIIEDENYNSERPDILYAKEEDKIALAWEKSGLNNKETEIYYTDLDAKGNVISPIINLSKLFGVSQSPKISLYKNKAIIAWAYKNDGVSSLYVASKNNNNWAISKIRKSNARILFPQALTVSKNIQILWQEGYSVQNVMQIQPDTFVAKAKLFPMNLAKNRTSDEQKIAVKIKFPKDSSGIAGYAYKWSKDNPPENINPEIMKLTSDNVLTYTPNEDGLWYLGVRVCDYAGNWSDIATTYYKKDTTPPQAPVFDWLVLDKNAFVDSNSFKISWQEPSLDISGKEEQDIRGYIYKLYYLGNIKKFKNYLKENNLDSSLESINDEDLQKLMLGKLKAKNRLSKINLRKDEKKFYNFENGFYAISVCAVDNAGNIGVPGIKYFALNKYKPFTSISHIESVQASDGSVTLSLIGKGFTAEGKITEVYIDKDGKSPYDLVLDRNDFSILSDRMISKIKVLDMEEGKYKIGVKHSKRGLYFSKRKISIDNMGNVKFGDYTTKYKKNWSVKTEPVNLLNYLPLIFALLFILLICLFSIFGISKSLKEIFSIRKDLQTLLDGGIMTADKKAKTLKVKRGGLRRKFILFTTSLVLSVILILAIPLGLRFSKSQEKLLIESLTSRAEVLLESLTLGAKAYLPSKNFLELSFLPAQIYALEEAKFATITGEHINNAQVGFNFIWASNDEDIENKIGDKNISYGETKIVMTELDAIYSKMDSLNASAVESVGSIAREINALTNDFKKIALKTDKKSIQKREEIQISISQMEEKLNLELMQLSIKGSGIYPEFSMDKLSKERTEYLFYKPIMYRQSGDTDNFVHGMVFLEVSTSTLLEQIAQANRSLYQLVFYISLISLAAGVIGAYVLASIIIAPIRRLVDHVAMISATENKELLAGKNLKIKSKDEIGILGRTINDMTDGLVAAASASKDLTMGKEIQKMFLPLEVDSSGKKLTCSQTNDDSVEFFGYYEGSRGVSGDYFDYIKLDERYYAIIKCDVAGKGVPAALIMVEVATLFLDYFKDWNFKKYGTKIDALVSRINDLIEARGFTGSYVRYEGWFQG